MRHQLAHAREVLAAPSRRVTAPISASPDSGPGVPAVVDERAIRSHSGPPSASSRSKRSARAGVRRAHEHEHAGAAARGAVREAAPARRAPSSGLSVIASAPRPGLAAERRRRCRRTRPARRRRRCWRCRRAWRRRSRAGPGRARARRSPRARASPAKPSRSKQASWGLTATQAGPAASISARQWASTAAAACSRMSRAGRRRASPAERSTSASAVHEPRARLGHAPRPRRARACSGPGRCPSTTWDSRAATAAASRSPKAGRRGRRSAGVRQSVARASAT